MAVAPRAARAAAAILGAQVADAAAAPSHWVYDTEKLAAAIASAKRGPAFLDPPAAPFYRVPAGKQTGYGDQLFVLLASVAEVGAFDVEDFTARLAKAFGRESEYELDGVVDSENWPDLIKDTPMPVSGPWRHGSIKLFLKNYVTEGKRYPECGAPDDHLSIDGVAKIVPLVARYAGDEAGLSSSVEAAIRATQNTDGVVKLGLAFARCLELLILGSAATPAAAVAAVAAQLRASDPGDAVAPLLERVVGDFAALPQAEVGRQLKPEGSAFAAAGLACSAPAALQMPLHAACTEASYQKAVEAALCSGGDNASRAGMAGALAAAAYGREAIPAEWLAMTLRAAEVEQLTAKLLAACPAS